MTREFALKVVRADDRMRDGDESAVQGLIDLAQEYYGYENVVVYEIENMILEARKVC